MDARAVASPLQPLSVVCHDPLAGLRPQDATPAPVGATLAELAPATDRPLVCSVLGVEGFILREQWGYRLRPGDIVVWQIDPPQGREGGRTLLAIATVLSMIVPGGQVFTPWLMAASMAYNLLLPPTGPKAQSGAQWGAPEAVYATSLQGNQARLDQPIWKCCGRVKITPPFAAEPYFEYRDDDGNDLNNQQYYYALLAVGVGAHTLEAALIGDTPVAHFADVLVAKYLAPGVAPSQALANVNTSSVVAGQVLEPGKYVGGFTACLPKRRCAAVGIDIIATRGLGKGAGPLTVAWRVEAREINDFGVATGPWKILGTGTKTAATNTPQRWSQKLTIATPARVEVRVVRTDVKDADTTALHELAWGGLRAYLADPAPLNASTAHYEVVLRASDQLSQISQRSISLIVQAHARAWKADTGWASYAYTRTPAWWLLDLATNPVWGLGLPDERVDLPSFAAFAAANVARQDRFDYVFDNAVDAWSALQLIARAGRARVFRRNGVLTIARDELATIGVTAFSPRNTVPGSMAVTEGLPQREQADAVTVEYLDNRTWAWTSIECPCPGVATPANPVRKRLEGITGATHAQREGLYEAANLAYRRRVASCTTEMQGALPAFMSAVRWQPDLPLYGQSGDVCAWDLPTLTMGLSEPAAFGEADLYLTLIRDDGSLTAPVRVQPGPEATDVVLPAAPDFTLVLDSGARERPKYLLGTLTGDELVKLTAIRDGGTDDDGAQLYALEAIVDDPRVHAADNAFLPGPGDIQDPVDGGSGGDADDGGGGIDLPLVIALAEHEVTSFENGRNAYVTFTLRNNGSAGYESSYIGAFNWPREWVRDNPVEIVQAAKYEVRLTETYNNAKGTMSGAAVGSWVSLGSTRYWRLFYAVQAWTDTALVKYKVEIREAASGIVQSTARLSLSAGSVGLGDVGGGGGGGGGVPPTDDGGPGGTVVPGDVKFPAHEVNSWQSGFALDSYSEVTLKNDGSASWTASALMLEVFDYPGEWHKNRPVAGSVADDYEVCFNEIFNDLNGEMSGADIGVWLNLGTTRTWRLTRTVKGYMGTATVKFRVEFREVATGILRSSTILTMGAGGIGTGDVP
jgi:hypothetical protein